MELHYISRKEYRKKHTDSFIKSLQKKKTGKILSNTGGWNKQISSQGTSEILDEEDTQNYICTAIGTGGTISGIINSSSIIRKY